MAKRTSRADYISVLSLKLLYVVSKLLGMVNFKIKDGVRVKYSRRIHVAAVFFKLVNFIGSLSFLSYIFNKVLKDYPWHVRALIVLNFCTISIFTGLFMLSQTFARNKFTSILNRSIKLLMSISKLPGQADMFGHRFYAIIMIRLFCSFSRVYWNLIQILAFVSRGNYLLAVRALLACWTSLGSLVLGDFLCLGFLVSSYMFANIGKSLRSLVKRIEIAEQKELTKFQTMQLACEFADELDNCSEMYSQIFKITHEFYALFEIYAFIKFINDSIWAFGFIHCVLADYIKNNVIEWKCLVLSFIQVTDLMLIVFVIDEALRQSNIPNKFHLESLFSDTDSRWDKTVDSFLNQMRLEALKVDVYGLFEINNGLSLRFLSFILAYITIMIQFSMLGYKL